MNIKHLKDLQVGLLSNSMILNNVSIHDLSDNIDFVEELDNFDFELEEVLSSALKLKSAIVRIKEEFGNLRIHKNQIN